LKDRWDVVVVGAGYVGLTLSIHLVLKGLRVLAIDQDEARVAALARGEIGIYETGIREALREAIDSGRFGLDHNGARAAAWILATSYAPGSNRDCLPGLDTVCANAKGSVLVAIRSTVPIGYTRARILPVLERQFGTLDKDFYLVSCPERTLSGAALEELAALPQLLGGTPGSCREAVSLFERAGIPTTTLPSLEATELAKTFTNFSRFVQFNLSNYLGVLCQELGLSDRMILEAVKASYPRLSFLSGAGSGTGGFCLPKDGLILAEACRELALTEHWLKPLADFPKDQYSLNQEIIQFHQVRVAEMTRNSARILALGVAFKGQPVTNDTRGSVGLETVRFLLGVGRAVEVFDCTVETDELVALGVPVAPVPVKVSRYDSVLILNNDPSYREILLDASNRESGVSINVYDPWRLIVRDNESIHQEAFDLTSVVEHP